MKRSTDRRKCPAEIRMDFQRHYSGLADKEPNQKAKECFKRPAFQARKLIREQSKHYEKNN